MRHLQTQALPATPNPDIEMIQGHGPYLDQCLARAGLRIGEIAVTQYVNFAVLLKEDSFQIRSEGKITAKVCNVLGLQHI